jgi:putative oxidoreductase
MEFGLLLLRLTVGLTLAAHGAQKLFGWFGGHGLDAMGPMFEALGFHPGRRHALMAGVAEVGGGLLVALGALTPVGAALVFSVMIVAAVSVHLKNGFFVTSGGIEYNVVLGLSGLMLAFTGPGVLSMDALLGWPTAHGGVRWGLAAFVLGLIGASLQLAQRRTAPAMAAVPAKS